MKNTKYILTVALAAFLFASCNLLNVDNPSAIYGSGYWSSPSEVSSYLTGVYTSFRSTCNTIEDFEARSDEFTLGVEAGGSIQFAQNLTSLNGVSWADYYSTIQHCNMVIKNADKVTFPKEEDKNEILAQAYTMRAYMFFCLTRLWGKVPLETEATEGSEKEKKSRASCEDVIGQVIEDATTAVGLFKADGWTNGKSCASKRAAYALIADAYLWKAKVLGGGDEAYAKVIEYADLAAVDTELEPVFGNIYATRNGKEVIWSIHFGYPEIDAMYAKFMTLRDVFVAKAVNMDEIPYAKSGARSTYAPSREIRALFGVYPGDVRKTNAYVDAIDASGTVLATSQRKMPGTKTETNVIYDNDIVLYRHAEMILFRAEAYAAMGQVDQAIAELNKIRRRAGIGDYAGATDKQTVEREILDERGREFWLERKRWPDLLRFHYEGVIDIYQVVPSLKARYDAGTSVPLYLSIPLSEMSLNHNLVQTEGYENL